ncbi:M28 family metallopeptidase [Aurantibacillus circumpalustris]|uniref:M28 family metallopeptidase n=1 Tax=Aurantibacillus circumpalustris TaxID=3036359 RepID=UPI00295B2EE0|nr:M28 family metallopeptidase [Aurantibacillus circumpalustris]
MRLLAFAFLLLLFSQAVAQDTVYARKVIRHLTSEKCFGRGYVKNGLCEAEKFITSELKNQKPNSLFGKSYTQSFFHPVNTFPSSCELSINGKLLKPGEDFILSPEACSSKGKFSLQKVDTTHFIYAEDPKISLSLKNKLTYSVGREVAGFCGIEIDRTKFKEEPKEIEVNIKNKFVSKFESKNIGCFINGSLNSDSLIVFSAHYDHLGGMGKSTFFPGANDNASGVSVILNLIKYYQAHPPKYKTVFLFFAGEEAGLLGSKFFVESNMIDLYKIKFLVNLDLLGTGDDGIMVVNGAVYEKEFSQLAKINAEQNLVKEIKKRGKASNSDHYWFSEKGVHCFFIYTMGGIKAYHDVYDIEKTLPLTDYVDVFHLLTEFISMF